MKFSKLSFDTMTLFAIVISLVGLFGFLGPKLVSSNNDVEVIVGIVGCSLVAFLIVVKIVLLIINFLKKDGEE